MAFFGSSIDFGWFCQYVVVATGRENMLAN